MPFEFTRQDLSGLTDEEKKERRRQQNKRACERRAERKLAFKEGREPQPLLATRSKDDAERKKRHADREKIRRVNWTDEQIARERQRAEQRIYDPVKAHECYIRDRDRQIENVKRWAASNPEKVASYKRKSIANRKQRLANNFGEKERNARKRRERENARRQVDPEYRLKQNLRSSIKQAFRLQRAGRKTTCTLDLVGCTMADLIMHLEAKFAPGMDWTNYGNAGWHIDHIRPCASFDLTDPAQQRQCFHYTNLQPLWSYDNLSKSSIYEGVRHRRTKQEAIMADQSSFHDHVKASSRIPIRDAR